MAPSAALKMLRKRKDASVMSCTEEICADEFRAAAASIVGKSHGLDDKNLEDRFSLFRFNMVDPGSAGILSQNPNLHKPRELAVFLVADGGLMLLCVRYEVSYSSRFQR